MKKLLPPLLIMATVGIATVGLVASEEEERDESHEREHTGKPDREGAGGRTGPGGGRDPAYLSDPGYGLYQTECGSCHMAYPPALLPAPSWRFLMGSLDDHFGDSAELDARTAGQIADFLVRNAASDGRGRYAEGTWHATRGRAPPLRITETDYFRGQHHEIPAEMVTGNPAIGSFARCEVCHSGAARGDFDEHGVRIPDHGRRDD